MQAPDQIRTFVRTFRDRLFTEIFPGRTEVPKTLIFAKDDNHAEKIVEIVREELRERFGERLTELDSTGVQAVVPARVEGTVTNGRMQEITGGHPKDITGVLQGLVRNGFLEQQNQRRWASYRLPSDSPQFAKDSPQSSGDSPQFAGDFPQSHSASTRFGADVTAFPAELLVIAEPARSKAKLPRSEVRRVIASLCADRWLTAKQLGTLMNRDPENLQQRFLTAMVKEGALELRYPEVPNRPDQAYRTTKQLQ